MDIECYDKETFKWDYSEVMSRVCITAAHYGVDLTLYEFGQYIKSDEIEDITYNHKLDEDACFNICFTNGKLDSINLSTD